MSDTDRWQRLQQLFAEASALDAQAREAWIDRECADDAPMAAELRSMLRVGVSPQDGVADLLGRAAGDWLDGDRRALVGRLLGPWRILSHLADGGMGAVYRAERADGQYQQQVAVKLLNPALVGDAARARLAAERQILARLSHPSIARLLDGGRTADGAPYLVMEFVDGLPIDDWCEQQTLDTPARLRLFIEVCHAVDFAHRNLVVHRDLKPGNILVDTEGRPRLLDFGIARLLDAEGMTRSGDRLLTPSHASPEQIVGGAITTATDIYALGVLLHQLLAGCLPHARHGSHAAAMARAIVEQEPTRPSSALRQGDSRRLPATAGARELDRLVRELSGDLDTIVLMALRKEPSRRYATARQLAEDIERHLRHLPVKARADTLAYRAGKLLQRHPVALPAGALAVLALLVGAGTFTWRLSEERDRALAAERSAQRAASYTAAILKRTGAHESAQHQVPVRDLLHGAAQRLEEELGDEPEVALRIRIALGDALYSWGEFDAALKLFDEALAALGGERARPDVILAELLSLTGAVTHDLGQLEVSLDWARQAEATWRDVGTPAQHGRALQELALALNGLRRRTEAEPVFRDALARLTVAHADQGGDHVDVVVTLNNLAWGLHAMGRLDEAGPIYEQALAMALRLDLPDVERYQTISNLAGLHWDRGDFDEAERLWRDMLDRVTRLYGAEGHPAVARGQALLALVLLERGLFEEAQRLLDASVRTNVKLLGERHRWTAAARQSQGIGLLSMGRLDDAERVMEIALATRREVLPPRHADLVGTHHGLARLALERRDLSRAESELYEALAIIDGLNSPDRVQRDRIEWTLGQVLARQGRLDEARLWAGRALALRRLTMPETHPQRLLAEAAIALPPFVDQPAAEARATARATIDVLRRRLGPGAPLVRQLEARLGPELSGPPDEPTPAGASTPG